jgi:toxin ParE1/3/4
MLRLRYSAASKDDLKEIARFIAKDKPVAARQWVEKIREKCRLAAKHPDIGDDRRDLGEDIRSTYVGSYIIYFREKDGTLEIVRVVRGDLEFPFL